MYRIRFHGRGGQGIKTSSRILGTAFFLENYVVQDAPKYGAERRGAPISAYVRADRTIIYERGVMHNPDLVIVADESLLSVIPEAVFDGVTKQSFLLINSKGNITEWKEKYNISMEIIYLPAAECEHGEDHSSYMVSTSLAAAAAALTGKISWENVEKAIRDEHSSAGFSILNGNIQAALYAYEKINSGSVRIAETENPETYTFNNPGWVTPQFHHAGISTPSIHNCRTSSKNITGSWRIFRPLIKENLCSRCSLCSVYCPENAIIIKGEEFPCIDFTFCKGCLICVSVCPKKAIDKSHEISQFNRKHHRG